MRIVVNLFGSFLLLILVAMAWQHFHYLDWRRTVIHDQQLLVYSSEALHVLTTLRLAPGEDLIEALSKLRSETEGIAGSRWIYAGKTVLVGIHSEQLGKTEWDGAVLVQYPSHGAYEDAKRTAAFREGWARIPESYSHGMTRSPVLNLGLPMFLLGVRVVDYLIGPALPDPYDVEDRELLAERLANPGVKAAAPYADAIVVLNLILHGDAEQRRANQDYGRQMMRLFAAGRHGPAHIGRARTLEGEAKFDQVVLVYYPGLDYFLHLVSSRFFTGIVAGKQLGDTFSMLTVPILDRL